MTRHGWTECCKSIFERTLDVKKLVALGVLGVLIGSALPAGAVTQTGTVTVKWNTAVTATLALNNNYSATGASQTTAPGVFTNNNTGSGTCAGPASEVAATVNFGTITPDTVQNTNCLYDNAIDAKIVTNSVSWNLTEALSAVVSGTTMCALGNGQTFPFPGTGALPVTQTTRTSNALTPSGTSCPASSLALSATAATAVTSTTAYTGGAHIGEDMWISVTPSSTTGAQAPTLTYTLTAN